MSGGRRKSFHHDMPPAIKEVAKRLLEEGSSNLEIGREAAYFDGPVPEQQKITACSKAWELQVSLLGRFISRASGTAAALLLPSCQDLAR